MTMLVLDLFAGTKGWSAAFADAGHDVISIDNDERFDVTAHIDALDFHALRDVLDGKRPDLILASPPCNSFSTGTMGRMWEHGPHAVPKHPTAVIGMRLVQATVALITVLRPRYYVVENPQGRLRSLDLIPADWSRSTIWQCHLGKEVAKPTDLWHDLPSETFDELTCHNQRRGHPEGCCCKDHRAAPRGSTTGTQGMSRVEAGAIPYALSERVLRAVERLEAMSTDEEAA